MSVTGPGEALGQSEAFIDFQEKLSRAAKVDRPVLIVGQRGTGKELAANRLHYLSPRWREPLVTLNSAALAPTLIESELFGYEAGAFTGATARRAGRFESADEGALFLDEIGLIPMEVQEKILRVVEYGSFERVGSTRPITVNVRLIAATNSHLPGLVEQGKFKADLLDRLAFEVLHLPPLKDRGQDILLLARHFAARMATELGLAGTVFFSHRAEEELLNHTWPGNIRELKNVVERAVYRSPEPEIDELVFNPFPDLSRMEPSAPPGPAGSSAAEPTTLGSAAPELTGDDPASDPAASLADLADLPLKEAIHRLERVRLIAALAKARHNQRRAADMLGLSYDQFRGLYRKHKDALGDPDD